MRKQINRSVKRYYKKIKQAPVVGYSRGLPAPSKLGVTIIVLIFAGLGARQLFFSSAATLNTPSSVNAPTGLIVTESGPTQVALSWTASTSSGVTGYAVIRTNTQTSTTSQVATTDSYTTNYLDSSATAGTPYSYAVEALAGSIPSVASNPATVTTSATQPTVISSCSGQVLLSGNYVLTASLTDNSPNLPCFSFGAGDGSTTSNVALNCQGNSITTANGPTQPNVITVGHLSNFIISNCSLVSGSGAPSGASLFSCSFCQSGVFANNTLKGDGGSYGSEGLGGGSSISIAKSSGLIFSGDTITNTSLTIGNTSNSFFSFNNFSDPSRAGLGWSIYDAGYDQTETGFTQNSPTGNVFDTNTIDGGTPDEHQLPGYAEEIGSDDGINLGNDTTINDVLVGNKISNVWDCDVEASGFMNGSVISNNTFNNGWNCGLGGWYYNSWLNNTIANNHFSADGEMFMFRSYNYGSYIGGPSGSGPSTNESEVFFQNNTFTNNIDSQPIQVRPSAGEIGFSVSQAAGGGSSNLPVVASNNVYTNNNFLMTLTTAAFLSPASSVVDGGGNICNPIQNKQYDGGYPLNCVNPGASDTVPPSVNLTGPANNSTLTASSATFSATASAASGIENLYLYLDSKTASPTSGQAYALVDCSTSPCSYVLDTSKLSAGPHFITAVAYNNGGISQTSNTLNFTIPGTYSGPRPNPPSNFTLNVISHNQEGNAVMASTWSPSAQSGNPISGYRIYQETNGGSPVIEYDSFSSSATYQNLEAPPLSAGQSVDMTYYVVAYDSTDAVSLPSNQIKIDIEGPGVNTTQPTVSFVTPASGSTITGSIAHLSVSATAYNSSTIDHVQYYFDGSSVGPKETGGPSYGYNLGVFNYSSGSHTLGVVATDNFGINSSMVTIPITVNNGGSPPNPPTSVTAIATAYNNVNVSWPAATDSSGTVAGYYIWRSTNGAGYVNQTPNGWTSGTSYADSLVNANTSYTYEIVAYDTNHNSSNASVPSPTVTTPNPPDTTPPTAPTGVSTSVISSSQINLSWTASTDNVGVVGYNVFRSTSMNGNFTQANSQLITTTSYGDSGLQPSTTYYYYVKAYDAAGNPSQASSPTAHNTTANAQSSSKVGSAELTVVSKATGSPIAGANVSIIINNVPNPHTTNSNGQVVIGNLAPLSYTVDVCATGYQFTVKSIVIHAGQQYNATIYLPPATHC